MSEYIPRLREELVAAATRERAGERRRRALPARSFAPVLAAAVIAAAVVLAVSTIELADDEQAVPGRPAGVELAYRVSPDPGASVTEAAQVLRARLAASGLAGARVTVTGDRLAVDVERDDAGTAAALAVPGVLEIFDWETSVLGPDGRVEPENERVTGGPDAGRAGSVSRAEAARRVAKVPGAHLVRAEGAGGWYALEDTAAITNADITQARATTDPATGEPIVVFDFDPRGQSAFSALTRTIAGRGAVTTPQGADPLSAAQHLAMVLDDQIVSVPFIHPKEAPNGIDGSQGAQIQGGLTGERARIVAAILDSGPLPARLEPL